MYHKPTNITFLQVQQLSLMVLIRLVTGVFIKQPTQPGGPMSIPSKKTLGFSWIFSLQNQGFFQAGARVVVTCRSGEEQLRAAYGKLEAEVEVLRCHGWMENKKLAQFWG